MVLRGCPGTRRRMRPSSLASASVETFFCTRAFRWWNPQMCASLFLRLLLLHNTFRFDGRGCEFKLAAFFVLRLEAVEKRK